MSKLTVHFGTHVGRSLKAGSFIAELLTYPDNEPLEFTIQKQRIRKSTQQNSYLHKLFEFAARFMNEAGFGDGVPWTKERIKDYCKQAGLYPTYVIETPKGPVTMSMDTRELSKEETAITIDNVMRHFADEFGIYLPNAGEQMHLEVG